MSSTRHQRELRLPPQAAGRRLDQALADALPEFSRSRLKRWIDDGMLRVDGRVPRPRDIVAGGERIALDAPDEDAVAPAPEDIELAIAYEDRDVIVVDKPAGLVVHPGAGNPAGTLQNALLAHDRKLAKLPRAGIVHRLDKGTTGLLIVARSESARTKLAEALAARSIHREYQAVCVGVMTAGGKVDAPIDRHPVDRLRMAVRASGREAITHYRVIERFRRHTWVRVTLETGRTHQIRLHLSHAGYPLVGDPVYGRRLVIPRGATAALAEMLRGFRRQALHAAKLSFPHPRDGRMIEVESKLPADIRALIAALKRDRDAAAD
ncbi:MAG TPA: 23S rRNA pseudouridine(1911/1915/1917) synthase RluD [Steroidobacteraceae bacterium]|jgi:23S rRNA pseudouridine1911/1915/1917 synthase|nr:23S rRNA pseudouridine(1911/1915/1917) synthase RluD [Steroidobacteraceae bacterium]